MTASAKWIYINGLKQASVPASDRGLAYGHGLFETMLVVNGQAILAAKHIKRLKLGCSTLGIPFSVQLEAIITDEIKKFSAKLNQGVLKLIVTAGSEGRGYGAAQLKPCRILAGYAATSNSISYRQHGIAIRTCNYRLPINEQLAGIKHLNRLDQIMARREWANDDWCEGIMLDQQGMVVEGIMTNLFAVIDDALITPLLDRAGVAGVMRGYLLDQAEQLGLSIKQVRWPLEDFLKANEVFVCNSVIGIWPIRKWDQCTFNIGKITNKLIKITDELLMIKVP